MATKVETHAFRPGFHARGMDPGEVARELKKLGRAAGGAVTPEAVVEAASDPASPLHAGFTWDDGEAAREYRLHQARTLIRAVVIVKDDTPPRNVFIHVRPAAEGEAGGYYPRQVLARSPCLLDRALDELRGKLAGAQRAYRDAEQLARGEAKAKLKPVGEHIEAAVAAASV